MEKQKRIGDSTKNTETWFMVNREAKRAKQEWLKNMCSDVKNWLFKRLK